MPEYTVGSNVSVSRFMVEEMDLPDSSVSTVIDGVHTDFFRRPSRRETLRTELGISPSTTRWSSIPGPC